jgi:hypothetical protein
MSRLRGRHLVALSKREWTFLCIFFAALEGFSGAQRGSFDFTALLVDCLNELFKT